MNIGYILAKRYVCKSKLGQGSFGHVYLAYDIKLDKTWAIKVCSHFSKQEIFALKQINHYMFPRIVDVIIQDDLEYLVMDYIEGETLSSYCRTHNVSERQAIGWFQEIAYAMHYLHCLTPSVIYSDLKPDNIIVTPTGEIRIVDFGSIYVDTIKSDNITGTSFYAPSELNCSCPTVSSDIYSFGMTMYRIMTGSTVLLRDKKGVLLPERINKTLSSDSLRIIKRCTQIEADKRFHSMSDIIGALDHIDFTKNHIFLRISRILTNQLSSILMAILQIVLATTILVTGYLGLNPVITIIAGIAFALSIVIKRPVNSWETKKEIIKVSMFLSLIAISAFAIFNNIKGVSSLEERLDVTLYDSNNCKLLVRPGATWEVDDDIVLSLSKKELSSSNTITITCNNEYGSKSYSFLCSAK